MPVICQMAGTLNQFFSLALMPDLFEKAVNVASQEFSAVFFEVTFLKQLIHQFANLVSLQCMFDTALERILVDFSILHDDFEVVRGVGHQIEVFQRVAIHQQQVSQRTFFNHTECTRIRITRTAHLE
jgi:hypothetical protein